MNPLPSFFSALGGAPRQELIHIIATQPGLKIEEISTQIDLAHETVRHHIGVLWRAQIIVKKKDGPFVRFHLNPTYIHFAFREFLKTID